MFQVPAILTSFSTRADGGASVRFVTNEISDAEFLILKKSHNQFGYLLFKENPFQPSDIPTEVAEDASKTSSKRLRATLYVLWQQKGSQSDFEAYYRTQMEKIITHVKTKLDS